MTILRLFGNLFSLTFLVVPTGFNTLLLLGEKETARSMVYVGETSAVLVFTTFVVAAATAAIGLFPSATQPVALFMVLAISAMRIIPGPLGVGSGMVISSLATLTPLIWNILVANALPHRVVATNALDFSIDVLKFIRTRGAGEAGGGRDEESGGDEHLPSYSQVVKYAIVVAGRTRAVSRSEKVLTMNTFAEGPRNLRDEWQGKRLQKVGAAALAQGGRDSEGINNLMPPIFPSSRLRGSPLKPQYSVTQPNKIITSAKPTQHTNNQSAKYPTETRFVENTSLAERLWYEGAEKCRDQIPKLGLRFEAETQEFLKKARDLDKLIGIPRDLETKRENTVLEARCYIKISTTAKSAAADRAVCNSVAVPKREKALSEVIVLRPNGGLRVTCEVSRLMGGNRYELSQRYTSTAAGPRPSPTSGSRPPRQASHTAGTHV
ncbi:hypothetical protein DFH09DRAFT_1084938 [Mycena vulgaris]|nr:hypothetical protein DFH09DRAFT_1084938 [Mycena vulgaris]